MRVALVIERFEPRGGGVESVAWNVAHRLASHVEALEVVAREADPSAGVPVHRVSAPAFWQPLRVALFSRRVGRYLRDHPFDVVQTFSRTRHQDVYRAGGGSHAEYMRHRYTPRGRALRRLSPRHALLLAIERAVFADPDQHVLCVSDRVRQEIETGHGVAAGRLSVIPNGVDTVRFAPRDEGALRASLLPAATPQESLVWLLAGSGFRRKGLDTALRALARTESRHHHLWVAGADPPASWQRLAAVEGVADRVRFLGRRPDLERVLCAADGLLLPTRYDAFANVCLEAAACGRPVVTSGRSGSAEAIEGGCAVVADPEDAEGFAAVLDALARDPVRRAAMGRRGRERAEFLSWDGYVDRLLALYREIAAS